MCWKGDGGGNVFRMCVETCVRKRCEEDLMQVRKRKIYEEREVVVCV